MDYTKIPHFALHRQTGTVLIRLKMEISDICRPLTNTRSDYAKVVHRPTSCEQCSRTRLNSQYSDCDSDIVDKCRPYRSSTARSRYVNVCAAVCLVLLVGGLSPQSSAAPHKRNMERQRRAVSEDEALWASPCDYDNTSALEYTPAFAIAVASQAKNARVKTAAYKDTFAWKLHTYESFDKLLLDWSSTDWLRNFTWFREEGLPKEKVLNQRMPKKYLSDLMEKIDDVLPSMYKGLQMIVASLKSISKDGLNTDNASTSMKSDIIQSMHDVRAVLCLFYDLMRSRKLEIPVLKISEVPDIKTVDKLSYALLVYRDTLNYLEYLEQVCQELSDMGSNKAD